MKKLIALALFLLPVLTFAQVNGPYVVVAPSGSQATPVPFPTLAPTQVIPTAVPTWTPAPTNTPVLYSTPGKAAIFSTPGANLKPYAGSTPCPNGGSITSLDGFLAPTCATPVPFPTLAPTQVIPTPVPTAVLPLSSTNGGTGGQSTASTTGYPVITGGAWTFPTAIPEAGVANLPTDLANLAAGQAGSGSPGNVGSYLVSGCGVALRATTAYTYDIAACNYVIQGVSLSSAATSVTLSAADATNDRVDTIVVNDTPIATNVSGTAAANPSEPSLDPSTQLKLVSITVTHNTTAPVGATNESIYAENIEWTSTAGTGSSFTDTGNPHGGSKDLKFTAVLAGAFAKLVRSFTINTASYQQLNLWVAPVTWTSRRTLNITLRDANAVQVGSAVVLSNGSFGLNTSSTSYQLIVIPVPQFAVPNGTLVKELRLNPQGTGGTFTFYVDDITLQSTTNSTPVQGVTLAQGDARWQQLPESTPQPTPTPPVNLTYSGKLNIADIRSNSASFTVAHRVEVCLGGSGNYTATMPTSPTVGDMYTIINEDTTHTCIITRAGSQTLNGATTLTLAAYIAPTRQGEHCLYLGSNNWYCEGPGA